MRAFAILTCAVAACGSPATDAASQLCEPYLGDHRRFVSWAVRTLAANPGRTREGLEETLFSPLFLDSGVVAARVVRGQRTFSWGDAIDVEPGTTVRVGEMTVDVAERELSGETSVVLTSREGTIEVTVAYRPRAER